MYYAYQRILSRIVASRWGEVATLRQMKRYDEYAGYANGKAAVTVAVFVGSNPILAIKGEKYVTFL